MNLKEGMVFKWRPGLGKLDCHYQITRIYVNNVSVVVVKACLDRPVGFKKTFILKEVINDAELIDFNHKTNYSRNNFRWVKC